MKWLGGNVFVDYRKITCDSDEFNDAVITIKNNVLSKNNMPKLIVGTVLSASYGIPGMWKLSEELKAKLGVHNDDDIKCAWIRLKENRYTEEQEVLFPITMDSLVKEYWCTPKQFRYYMRNHI